MKQHRLFWFLILLICVSLSCNVPGHDVLNPGKVAQVTSINVTPHSGTGNFSALVKGTTRDDVETSELVCYVAPDKADTKYRDDVSGNSSNGWSFTRDFPFTYNDLGNHTLVCQINDGSGTAWSEDFEVVPPPTLTITASSATMMYGGTVPTITPAYSGFVAGDTESSLSIHPVCSTTATSKSPAGKYPAGCSGSIDSNYTISYIDGSVIIAQAPLTIGASYVTMTQGGAIPTIAPSYYGFVAGDTESSLTSAPICSTTATSTSPVGKYPTSCSGAVDGNYTISYWDGWVEVTPATPTTLVLNGTFKLPEGEGPCANGTGQYQNSALAIAGTLVLTVDYPSGQASVTMQGTNTATVTTCNYPTATETWTIKGVILHGTIDPGTNTLAMAGDVPIDVASTCQVIDETNGGACIAGSQTVNSKMTLEGSVDPTRSTGTGQVTYTGYTNWGTWQAP